MKEILGFIVLIIIIFVSAGIAVTYFKKVQYGLFKKIVLSFMCFIGCIIAAYIILGIIGGFFWIFAWIGILIREVLQWLIESLLSPVHWMIS